MQSNAANCKLYYLISKGFQKSYHAEELEIIEVAPHLQASFTRCHKNCIIATSKTVSEAFNAFHHLPKTHTRLMSLPISKYPG